MRAGRSCKDYGPRSEYGGKEAVIGSCGRGLEAVSFVFRR